MDKTHLQLQKAELKCKQLQKEFDSLREDGEFVRKLKIENEAKVTELRSEITAKDNTIQLLRQEVQSFKLQLSVNFKELNQLQLKLIDQ